MKIKSFFSSENLAEKPMFPYLLGKTLRKVENLNNEFLVFTFDDGKEFTIHHEKDGRESVAIDILLGFHMKSPDSEIKECEL